MIIFGNLLLIISIWDLKDLPNSRIVQPDSIDAQYPAPDLLKKQQNPSNFATYQENSYFHPNMLSAADAGLSSIIPSKSNKKKDDDELDVPNVGFTIIPGHHGAMVSSSGI